MKHNLKMVLLSLVAILILAVIAGCGSSSHQPAKPEATPATQASSAMPNEDPQPIAQDLERKLKDTAVKVKEGKWADAKTIATAMLKTSDRLVVHVTDTRLHQQLKQSVKEAHDAVHASPADPKAAEAKIAAALEGLQAVKVQLQNHSHS